MTQPPTAKIFEISSYPPPRAGWGVRISFVREFLEAQGHICQVLNMGPNRRIKSPDYLDCQGGGDYIQKVYQHAKDGYLIHTHLNGDSPKGLLLVIVAQIFGWIYGRRCVLTFHAGPVQRLFPKHRSAKLAPLYKLAFLLPKTIICNSDDVKNNIVTYGISPEKIVSIPAFSRQYLRYTPVEIPVPLQEFMGKFRPIIVTYFFYRPEFFIESMLEGLSVLPKTMPEFGVVMIGADTTSEEITALIAKADLQDRVYQAGDLPHDDFATVLSRAHLYLRTPQKDGVCSSVLESLSHRIPVIASENGTRPKSVITFTTDDAYDMADKIEKAWKDYETVRSNVMVPDVKDTVADEAALLIDHAIS
jgi:glycosyltransferase involved in cell wall biosynthesis